MVEHSHMTHRGCPAAPAAMYVCEFAVTWANHVMVMVEHSHMTHRGCPVALAAMYVCEFAVTWANHVMRWLSWWNTVT